MKEKYFLSAPDMGENEIENIKKAFDENFVAPLGPFVTEFEERLKKAGDRPYAVAMNSGTSAIHIALDLLGVTKGDFVFCSSLTFIGSANPILYTGAKPVYIDSDYETWCMCPKSLEKAFVAYKERGTLPKAVIVVDIFGNTPHYDEILKVCNEYKVPVIEDAAESLGSSYNGKPCGSFGEYGIFSFNGNKIITTSGGGVLLCNKEEDAKRALFLITQARDPAPYYLHSVMGYNYRMSNICAAIGVGQMDVLSERVNRRREIFDYYKKRLNQFEFIPEVEGMYSNRWLSCFLLPKGKENLPLIEKLMEFNIEARPVWRPMHMQPIFSDCEFYTVQEGVSVAEDLFSRGICLPSWSKFSDEDLNFISDKIVELAN